MRSAALGDPRDCDGERGSGTVLVLALVAAAGTLLLMISLLARAESGRGAVQAAADLAVIAAAQRVADAGTEEEDAVADACRVARETARVNGCTLTTCDYRGGGVVEVSTSRGTVVGVARAGARAGPRGAPS